MHRDRLHQGDWQEVESAIKHTPGAPSADMNVTPLIDVLLVLLVIFMATLPIAQQGQDVNLPLDVTAKQPPKESKQVTIEYTADHKLLVNKLPLPIDALQGHLAGIYEGRADKSIFITGDPSVRYGEIMQLIDIASALHLKVAIVTEGMKEDATKR